MNLSDYRMRVRGLRRDPRTDRPDPLAVADAILGSLELTLVDEDAKRKEQRATNPYDLGSKR